MASDFVFVDSKFRITGTPSDFTFNLGRTLQACSGDSTHVRFENISLVNSLYTVEDGPTGNRFLYLSEGLVDAFAYRAIKLEIGAFSAELLVAHLQTLLGSAYTVAMLGVSNSLLIKRDDGISFHIMTDAELATLPATFWEPGGVFYDDNFRTPNNPCSFNDVLQNPNGAIVVGNTFLTIFLNLSRFSALYLVCDDISCARIVGPQQQSNIFARIDVVNGFSSILQSRSPGDGIEPVPCGNFTLRTMNFKLVDCVNFRPVTLRDDSLRFTMIFS